LQDEKKCYLTGCPSGLEKHHIMHGTANRKIADEWGCWVWLTPEMHRGTYGVHGREGHELDRQLKQACQIAFERIYGHDKWMDLFGKDYTSEEEDEE